MLITTWSHNKRFYISRPKYSRHQKMMWRRERAKYIPRLIATKQWIVINRPWEATFVCAKSIAQEIYNANQRNKSSSL